MYRGMRPAIDGSVEEGDGDSGRELIAATRLPIIGVVNVQGFLDGQGVEINIGVGSRRHAKAGLTTTVGGIIAVTALAFEDELSGFDKERRISHAQIIAFRADTKKG